ncbi:hypothetical protein ACFX13_007749 [Malus domestica]
MSFGSASEPLARPLFFRNYPFVPSPLPEQELQPFSITFPGSATAAIGSIGSLELGLVADDDFFFAFFSRS